LIKKKDVYTWSEESFPPKHIIALVMELGDCSLEKEIEEKRRQKAFYKPETILEWIR
jgi:hypothetical protein